MNTSKFRIWEKPQWWLFFAFAAVNIYFSLPFRGPIFYPDEYAVIAIGNALFRGAEWAYRTNMYFGYTFAPFTGLMTWLFNDISQAYVGMLVIKSFFIALVPFFTYKILDEVLQMDSKWIKILAAAAMGAFPIFAVLSKYLSNDTILHYTLIIIFYLIGKAMLCQTSKQKYLYSVLLAFFPIYAYASHGMGIAFIVALFLTIAGAHLIAGKALVNYPVFAGSFVFFFILHRIIRNVVIAAVFRMPDSGMQNSFAFSFNRMIQQIFTGTGISYFFKIFFSRLHYLTTATYGLFPLFLIIMAVFLFRAWMHRRQKLLVFSSAKETSDSGLWPRIFNAIVHPFNTTPSPSAKPRKQTNAALTLFENEIVNPEQKITMAIFAFSIIFCAIGLSALNNIVPIQTRHGVFFFYGRYFEYTVIPLLILGIYFVFSIDIPKKIMMRFAGISMASYAVLALFVLSFVTPHFGPDDRIQRAWVPALLMWIDNSITGEIRTPEGGMHYPVFLLGVICVIGFAVLLSLLVQKKNKDKAIALVALLLVFSLLSINGVDNAMLRLSLRGYNNFYSRIQPVTAALGQFDDIYAEFGNLYVVTTSLGGANASNAIRRSRGQLAFMRYNVRNAVRTVDAFDRLNLPDNLIVVSDRRLALDEEEFKQIYSSNGANIWIHGDEIIEYFLQWQQNE
ncbi:MAG: hypothetical protein FWD06_09520 [Oscillospiraceae bacterium]|nr:hypothetical protein [Oscillospiraceae bacterium]